MNEKQQMHEKTIHPNNTYERKKQMNEKNSCTKISAVKSRCLTKKTDKQTNIVNKKKTDE